MHPDGAVRGARPFAFRPVAIQLDTVAVGIPQVDRLAHAVIRRAFERDAGIEDPTHRHGECRAVGKKDREVVQPRRAGGRRRRAVARPRVQADVVMVAAGRDKDSVAAVLGRDLKAQNVAIERQGAVEIAYGQVDVANPGSGIDAQAVTTVSGSQGC